VISTIILTQDEERDIGRCLESLRWCDDIHVVDSGSTDSTIEIAQTFGAKIYQHQFHSFGEQRNWALDTCQLQHPWVLFLDADEVASPKFVSALEKACASADHDSRGVSIAAGG
jgi:glycosyltransferase involved in cell wall biosynthesis